MQLPDDTAALSRDERKQLCDLVMIGDLMPIRADKNDSSARYADWIIDPTATPLERFRVILFFASPARARLGVLGPFGVVLESHVMTRSAPQRGTCQ